MDAAVVASFLFLSHRAHEGVGNPSALPALTHPEKGCFLGKGELGGSRHPRHELVGRPMAARCRPVPGRCAARLLGSNRGDIDVQVSAKMQGYWRKNLWITGIFLAIWFVATYVVAFFAPALNGLTFLGFPFGFYMAAQGALIVYVLIIAFYARYMNRLDREYDVHDE